MKLPTHDERHPLSTLSPAQLAALHDAAKRRALELRREAIAAFWTGAGRWWRHALARLVDRLRAGRPVRA